MDRRRVSDGRKGKLMNRYHIHMSLTDVRFEQNDCKATVSIDAIDDCHAVNILCELLDQVEFDIAEIDEVLMNRVEEV